MVLEKITVQKGTEITFHSNELLFLAKSGQPYRGTLYIRFTSIGESFDTRDLKRYITTLRSKAFYAEDIAYEIFTTIDESIDTDNLGVMVVLSSRGGIAQRLCYGATFQATHKNNIFQVG